jgi:hypothetical protein
MCWMSFYHFDQYPLDYQPYALRQKVEIYGEYLTVSASQTSCFPHVEGLFQTIHLNCQICSIKSLFYSEVFNVENQLEKLDICGGGMG